MMYSWSLILFSACCSTLGNVLIKIASENWNAGSFWGLISFGLGGVFFYFLNLAGFIVALRYLNVSVAYPVLASISFILLAFASNYFLNEEFTRLQIFGLTLIILGLLLLILKQ